MKSLRRSRRLVRAAGCIALTFGLAGSAVATTGTAFAATTGPARVCCNVVKTSPAVGWGDNDSGELGNGSTDASAVYENVSGLNHVTMVAAGTNHALALNFDGTVWAWGDNNWGELGNGSMYASLVPEQVPNLTGVTQIAAGGILQPGAEVGRDRVGLGWQQLRSAGRREYGR
jgi:alpha-tubulin suppressor-like RCC1 family protein